MSQRLSEFDIEFLSPGSLALLLDFDGTLVDIAEHPSGVMLAKETIQTLTTFETLLDGAVAIVSGRTVEEIDRFFSTSRFAVAGIHGLERRDSRGSVHQTEFDLDTLNAISETLDDAIADKPGLLLERKPGSIALHYRQRPELAEFCHEQAGLLLARYEGVRLIAGKMVVEIKLGSRTKADAVGDFMAEPPFVGRYPICRST
jgi:trehalose 6-phosphate phosphatase